MIKIKRYKFISAEIVIYDFSYDRILIELASSF